jgi:hypothetical protein
MDKLNNLEVLQMQNMKNLDHVSMCGDFPSYFMMIFCTGEKVLVNLIDTMKKIEIVMYLARRF